MKSDSHHFAQVVVDGQLMLIPDETAWKQLSVSPELDGVRLGEDLQRVGFRQWRELLPYPEFSVALGRISGWPWWCWVLLKLQDRFQRVHIERLTCASCGWSGMTATPAIPDLYFGSSDSESAFQRALDLRSAVQAIDYPAGGLSPIGL
jgi:hypothetical protein